MDTSLALFSLGWRSRLVALKFPSFKRLELFRELLSGLKRVLFPYQAHNAHQAATARQYCAAAQCFGIELVE
jgi:ABC-type uncharacterized transport system substrate-binding protein